MRNSFIRSRNFAVFIFAFATACGNPRATEAPHAKWPLSPDEEATLVEALATTTSTDRLPASKWTIDGETVSKISPPRIVETFRKAGWMDDGDAVRSAIDERFEGWAIPIRKGVDTGRFRIVRPFATSTAKANVVSGPPGRLPDAADKETTAYVFDADAQVYVEIEIRGQAKTKEAKELLENLVRRKQ